MAQPIVPVKLDVAPPLPASSSLAPGDNTLLLNATGCGALTNDDLPRYALPASVTVERQPARKPFPVALHGPMDKNLRNLLRPRLLP